MLKKNKTKEFLLLYGYMVLVCLFTYLFSLNIIIMSLLIFGIPAFFFAYKRHLIKKDLLESLIFSIPFGIVIEYYCSVNYAWTGNSILPFKLLNYASIDILIWGVFYSFFVLSVYKYFFDSYVSKKTSKNYIQYLLLMSTVIIISILIYFLSPLIKIPFIYLQMVLVWVAILAITAVKRIKLFYRVAGLGLIFFPIGLLHEIVSLEVGHWSFPIGQHIGYLTLFNRWTFPFEELMWLFIVIPVMVILHEYFADNQR